MNPGNEPIEPTPIDPPDNTSDDATIDVKPTARGDVAQAPAINPPDNT